jgi:hypothetical protein
VFFHESPIFYVSYYGSHFQLSADQANAFCQAGAVSQKLFAWCCSVHHGFVVALATFE